MKNLLHIAERITAVRSQSDFDSLALEVFCMQAANNSIYRDYLQALGIQANKIDSVDAIPFLPISFFKTHRVLTNIGPMELQAVFRSSTTTGTVPSEHAILSLDLYKRSLLDGFSFFYGNPSEYCYLALLPSYLERTDSSLVFMVKELMQTSNHPNNGFFLNDLEALATRLKANEEAGQKTLLIGVTFALLDLAEQHPMPLQHTQVMETGGMKGKRKELLREELHEVLGSAFGINAVGSEYGMTELLSQAYAPSKGEFHCPPWMRVKVRDTQDPFSMLGVGKSGGLNVIDLANLYSCSFIETQDLARINNNGTFSVLGRFDHSDIRGCNLMAQL